MPTRAHVRASKRTSALCLLLLIGMSSWCFSPPPPHDHDLPHEQPDERPFQCCCPDPIPRIPPELDDLDQEITDVINKISDDDQGSTKNPGSSTRTPKSGKR